MTDSDTPKTQDSVGTLQSDLLPPFTIGTHVRRGKWDKQDTGEEVPTTPSDKYIKVNHISPGSNVSYPIHPPPLSLCLGKAGGGTA